MAKLDQESAIAWLDLSERNRQEMQEHLQLLAEPGTLDELGTGQIRDTFSNLFFPGTSTLWSRARYLLFVPWIYRQLEAEGTGRRSGREAARRLQRKLIVALRAGGDHEGLIGRQVNDPISMPDDLLWHGLAIWGIRVREGGLAKYRRSLEGDSSSFAVLRGDSGEALDAIGGSWWHPRLPDPPDGLLEWATFELEPIEAAFLYEQLQELHPESLLARALIDEPVDTIESGSVWDCAELVARLDREMADAVAMSRTFAYAIQGAGISYSWLVAVKKGNEGRDSKLARDLELAIAEWRNECDEIGVLKEMREWDQRRISFWRLVDERSSRLRRGTREFIDSWMALGIQKAEAILADPDVEELIRDREWQVKRNLARLSNPQALDMAKELSGTGLLPYRWFQVRRVVDDIARGLAGER